MLSHTLSPQERKVLEDELSELLQGKSRNFARLLNSIKRMFDRWAMERLTREVHPGMKIGFMPFLMNIGVHGITSGVLAQNLMVSKQAMSKTMKELEEIGLIEFRKNPKDARSQLIFLSDFGLQTAIRCRVTMKALCAQYSEMMGQENYEAFVDALLLIERKHLDEFNVTT